MTKPSPTPSGAGDRSKAQPQHGKEPATGITAKPWWPWAKRIATALFFGFVLWLLIDQGRSIEWAEVWGHLQDLPLTTLAMAAALVVASYTVYSTYDLLGRHLTGHKLSAPTVMAVTFVAYAFNLNLGSLVGAIAMRFRLYGRLGLDNDTTTRIVGFSMLTNWIGYLLLAGAAFTFWPLDVPGDWKIGDSALRLLGVALLLLSAGYLLLCATCAGKSWSLRGHTFSPPSLRLALLQLALSCSNWMLMAGVVWLLLESRVAYPEVLGVLLVAAVAGVITHVPAGLGVLEAVFVALMAGDIPRSELLAALLGYRALYYLAPLCVATVVYITMELRARKLASQNADDNPAQGNSSANPGQSKGQPAGG